MSGPGAQRAPADEDRRCDLVLGGGGIRGLAHIGAALALEEHGYRPARVAGASAGAVVGAFVVAGVPATTVAKLFAELDFRSFVLADVVGRLSSKRAIGGIVTRLTKDRIDPLAWIEDILGEAGIQTFGDLRSDDGNTPPERSYRLVVRCLDVVQRRVVRLPWDYHRYGLDPDEQPVAEAVRASMSIPLVYDPVPIGDPDRGEVGLLVDGGLTSGFPVSIFDRQDGRPARWPTFGIRLLSRAAARTQLPASEAASTRMVFEALLDASDLLEPLTVCDERRTIRIDVSEIGALNVDVGDGDAVVDRGLDAMRDFLSNFDEQAYRRDCTDRLTPPADEPPESAAEGPQP